MGLDLEHSRQSVEGLNLPLGNGPWPTKAGDFLDWRLASITTKDIHSPSEDRPLRLLPAHLKYAEEVAQAGVARISIYAQMKGAFEEALTSLPVERGQLLRDALEALRFIDNRDVLLKAFLICFIQGREFEALGIPYLYNKMRDPRDPTFENIKAVARFLKETDLPPGLERVSHVHALAMAGGIEGVRPGQLGKVRNIAVWGNERELGITRAQLARLKKNPYLSFHEVKCEETRHYGDIVYPDPLTIGKEALDRIRNSYPDIYEQVLRAQNEGGRAKGLRKLTRSLLEALVSERYETYNTQARKLGPLDNRKKVFEYRKLTALLLRDLVSIHPFVNGNGRSIRLDVFSLFDKIGISRPRLNNPDADLLASPSSWVEEVTKGILNTDRMYSDIGERIRFDLPIRNSGAIFFPGRPTDVGLHLLNNRKVITQFNVGLFPVDEAQFAAYVATRLRLEPALRRHFTTDPLAALDGVREDYKTFAKDTQYIFVDQKGKTKLVRAELADLDFIETFGENFASDKARWDYKVSRWYKPQFIWRGLSSQSEVYGTKELLDVFKGFSEFTLCQKLLEIWQPDQDNSQLVANSRLELARYNRDLVLGELWSLLQDHANATGKYPESYALSTSQRWTMARAFAMGALVIDEDMRSYRKRQDLLTSRVVVGAYQAHSDIELNTFKGIDFRFSARSGRQHEVAAMGGIDPDILMVAQIINAKGQIVQSLLRDPNCPSEIWLVDGGYHPDHGPLSDIPSRFILGKERI